MYVYKCPCYDTLHSLYNLAQSSDQSHTSFHYGYIFNIALLSTTNCIMCCHGYKLVQLEIQKDAHDKKYGPLSHVDMCFIKPLYVVYRWILWCFQKVSIGFAKMSKLNVNNVNNSAKMHIIFHQPINRYTISSIISIINCIVWQVTLLLLYCFSYPDNI